MLIYVRSIFFLVMDGLTLLEVECTGSSEMKPRVPNVAVTTTRGCRITLQWDEILARYVTSLRKFKLEKQLCFEAKVNIMHIQILQDGLKAFWKYTEQILQDVLKAFLKHTEDTDLIHYVKKK